MMETPLPPSSGTGRNNVQLLSSCPMCQTAYHPMMARVIAERDGSHLIFVECRQCGSAVVAFVTTDQAGMSSVGMLSDLTRHEVLRSTTVSAVTENDVLELHQFFNQSLSAQLILRRGIAPTIV